MKTKVPMLDTHTSSNDVLLTIIEYIVIVTGIKSNTCFHDIDSRGITRDYYLVYVDGELHLYNGELLNSISWCKDCDGTFYDRYDFLKEIIKMQAEAKSNLEKVQEIRKSCDEVYLDYFNNFITVGKFAEYYGTSYKVGQAILTIGREKNHE